MELGKEVALGNASHPSEDAIASSRNAARGSRGRGSLPRAGSLPGQWAWDPAMGSAFSRPFLPSEGQLWEPRFPIREVGAPGLWRSLYGAPTLCQASMVLMLVIHQ